MFYSAFASGWGMTGLCLVWGIKKNRARETFSCCDCQSRNSTGILKAPRQLGAASKCAQSCWEQGFSSQCYPHTGSCLPSLCLSPSRTKALAKPQHGSPVPPALQLRLEQLLSFFTLSPPERKPWSEILQRQPERYFLSFLRRRAEEWRHRGKGL